MDWFVKIYYCSSECEGQARQQKEALKRMEVEKVVMEQRYHQGRKRRREEQQKEEREQRKEEKEKKRRKEKSSKRIIDKVLEEERQRQEETRRQCEKGYAEGELKSSVPVTTQLHNLNLNESFL